MKGKKLNSREKSALYKSNPKERRKLFNSLLSHLSKGYSLECFADLSDTSVKTFFDLYPEEFVLEEYHEAIRKGRHLWEDIGHRQATGSCLGNSRTWYYNMSNRYGWRDKVEAEVEHKGSVQVQVVNYATMKPSTD